MFRKIETLGQHVRNIKLASNLQSNLNQNNLQLQ